MKEETMTNQKKEMSLGEGLESLISSVFKFCDASLYDAPPTELGRLEKAIDAKKKELLFLIHSRFVEKARVRQALEAIAKWPEPAPNAGEGLGPLAGTGMYYQYDHDKEKHESQVREVLKLLEEKE